MPLPVKKPPKCRYGRAEVAELFGSFQAHINDILLFTQNVAELQIEFAQDDLTHPQVKPHASYCLQSPTVHLRLLVFYRMSSI